MHRLVSDSRIPRYSDPGAQAQMPSKSSRDHPPPSCRVLPVDSRADDSVSNYSPREIPRRPRLPGQHVQVTERWLRPRTNPGGAKPSEHPLDTYKYKRPPGDRRASAAPVERMSASARAALLARRPPRGCQVALLELLFDGRAHTASQSEARSSGGPTSSSSRTSASG